MTFPAVCIGTPSVVAMTMKEMQQGASEKQQIRRRPEHMRPVLSEQIERADQDQRSDGKQHDAISVHGLKLLNLSALPMTLTDDSAIATAAMIGERSSPNTG